MSDGAWARQDDHEWNLQFLLKRYGRPLKIDLGPGRKPHKLPHASIGLNPSADPVADLWWDLNFGIPLPDESVDEYTSNQTLEHIERGTCFIHLMNDFWRTLVWDGRMRHCVPHWLSPFADGDPTHANRFTEKSFVYFSVRDDGTRFVRRFSDYGITAAFVLESQEVRSGVDITVVMRKERFVAGRDLSEAD